MPVYNDGATNAPAGSPQVPNLLNGYAIRAPWQVAGVDYAVGINVGTALKNPTTMNMAGVSVDTSNHVIFVTGNNVVLDGWNFKGWSVDVTGQNTTVTNSDFTNGVLKFDVGSVGGTVEYNKFDQNGTTPDTAPFMAFGSGKFVVAYNDFENSYHMAAQFTYGNGQSQTIIFQYNLIQNTGGGSAAGAHGDWIQLFGIPTVNDVEINYNTVVQNKAGYITQGWSVGYDQQTILAGSISNNTMIVPGTTNSRINYAVILDSHWIKGTFTVADNYSDLRGADSYLLTNDQWPGPYNTGKIVTSNDVNMVTGGYFYAPASGAGGPTAAATITAFSTDSGTVGDHITNDTTLTLTGNAAANSTVTVHDGANLLGTALANGSGAWSYTTAALANGAHSLTVTDTVSGTTSAASPALSIIIDTVAPAAPVIASFSTDTGQAGDHITSDNTLTLTGTAATNSTVTVHDGAKLLGTAVASGSGAWTYTTAALASGAHSFTATTTDAAGNTSGASAGLSVTITAPSSAAATIAAFSTDSGTVGDHITNDTTLTLTGNAAANSTVTVHDGANLLGTALANGSGAWSYTTAALANGAHSLTVTDTVSGTTSAASPALSIIIDTVAPAAPVIASFSTDTGQAGDHITSDNTLTLTGTAAANSTVTVHDGANLLGSAMADGGGSWSYTTAVLANGAHSLTATASDVAGNTSAASAGLSVTIAATTPASPNIHSFSTDTGTVGDHITSDNTLTLSGDAVANSTVTVHDGANLLGTTIANGSGVWNFATAPLTNGAHSFTATDTVSGATSAASAALTATIDTVAPATVVRGYLQNSDGTLTLGGTAEAGDALKIYDGTNFLGSTSVGSNGQWTYTTAVSSNAVHTFSSTATDVAGNIGKSAGAVIYGTPGNNNLVSGAGNDIMTGNWGADTFVFNSAQFGNDAITDFHPRSFNHDTLEFSHTVFDSFATVLAHAAQHGADVVITVDAKDSITLQNVQLSSLHKNDVSIV